MKKKLLVIGLSAVLVLANGSLAFAEEYSVSPRWVACGNCEDGGLVEVNKIRTGKGSCKITDCSHGHIFTKDHEHNWELLITAECNRCHSRTWYYGNEYDVECEYGLLAVPCPG